MRFIDATNYVAQTFNAMKSECDEKKADLIKLQEAPLQT